MFSPEISGTIYILSVSCISGDEVQVAIHERGDVRRWLDTLNHEGANWQVVEHCYSDDRVHIEETRDITVEIEQEIERG